MKKLLVCIGLALTLSACGSDHVIRFNFTQQPDIEQKQDEEPEPSYYGRSHFFLWGMFQKTDYDFSNVCYGKGIKAIEAHWKFWDSFMGGMTMGIYAPESFAVWCN